jgi:hypothetical protein
MAASGTALIVLIGAAVLFGVLHRTPTAVSGGLASDCALSIDTNAPLTSPHPPVGTESEAFVPTGAKSATICKYRGLNEGSNPGSLVHYVVLATAETATLTSELNAGTVVDSTKPYNCMDDNKDLVVTHFHYSNRSGVAVVTQLSGCMWSNNGRIIVTTGQPRALFKSYLGR